MRHAHTRAYGSRRLGRASVSAVAPLALASAMLTVACPRAAAAAPAPRLAVERAELENGVDLVLSTQTSVPIVAITCLVDGGARIDPPGKAGLAALAGGLLSEGTKGRSSQDIALLVDSLGGSFGTAASQDWIELDAAVLTRDFETGVDLVARSLREPSFPSDEVERARKETLGALASEQDNPHAVAQRALRRAVFGAGPYGHPVAGSEDAVSRLTRSDVVEFHRRDVLPERTLCAIVGDVATSRMREVASRTLGTWRADAQARPEPTPAPAPAPSRVLADLPLSQATIAIAQMGVARSNPDYFPLLLMNHVLGGGGFTSRLMQRIRTEGGLAYGVSSSFGSTRIPGLFQVSLQTKVESAAEAIGLVRAEIRKLHEEGATEEEIAAAKDYLTGSFPLRLDSIAKLTSFLAQIQYFGLGDDYIERYTERVRAVSLEEVRRAAARYLAPEGLVQVVVGPRGPLEKQGLGSSEDAP